MGVIEFLLALAQDMILAAIPAVGFALGYSEPLMITLLTNFLTASSIVGALSIGLSIPGLWLYRKRPRV